jgi:hypothetical protein
VCPIGGVTRLAASTEQIRVVHDFTHKWLHKKQFNLGGRALKYSEEFSTSI